MSFRAWLGIPVLATALAVASPLRAAPRETIILTGQTDSPIAKKIRAELSARGLDVREGDAPDGATRVAVHPDGHVTVQEPGAPAEDLRAEADENVFARRVAENVRARTLAPAEEPERTSTPPHAPPESPEPRIARVEARAPAPEPKAPVAPAQRFAERGAFFLSADDALPLVSVGRAGPLRIVNATQVGQTSGWQSPAPPRPFSFDYAVIDRLTIGITPIIEQTATHDKAGADGPYDAAQMHFVGGGARLGYVVPLGRHLVLWPRLGIMHLRWTQSDPEATMTYETAGTADVRLGWTPTGRWMLTLGPSAYIPLAGSAPLSASPKYGYPVSHDPRYSLSAGITVRLDDGAPDADSPEAAPSPTRFLLGVEHVAPLLRLRVRSGSGMGLDLGTTDTTNAFSQMPRLALDAAFGKFTVGGAANIGFGPDGFGGVALAPRIGALLQVSKSVALWSRAGATWLYSPQIVVRCAAIGCTSLANRPEHRLVADIDTFAIVMPAPSVGITVGPSLTLPIAESRSSDTEKVTLLGVSAGMVLLL